MKGILKAKEEVKTGAQMLLIVTIRNPIRMMLYKMPGFLKAELNRCYEKQKYKTWVFSDSFFSPLNTFGWVDVEALAIFASL